MSDIIQDTKARMSKSIDNLSRELANISALEEQIQIY